MNILRIKTVKRGFVIFLASIAIILFSNLPNAIAGDYLGEFCWSFSKTENERGPDPEGPGLMRAGVTYVGGAYYTIQGLIEAPDPVILGGTAVVVGNEVFMTANSSQDHSTIPWRDSGVFQIRLNISTLNGTWWSNYMSFNTNTRVAEEINYAAGTMTFTACP